MDAFSRSTQVQAAFSKHGCRRRGYRVEDDYSSHRWLEGATRIYLVTGNFPRITSGRDTLGCLECKVLSLAGRL